MAADDVRTLTGVLRIDFDAKKGSVSSGGKHFQVPAADYEAVKKLRKSTEVEFDVALTEAGQPQQIALKVRARAPKAAVAGAMIMQTGKQVAGKAEMVQPTPVPQVIGRPTGASAPYHFVPVEIEAAIADVPVWHDGAGSADRVSGEFDCVLTALTPLIVGNDQYEAQHAKSPEVGDALPKKKVIEPLRLRGGRVVIPDRSLKGMIRQSVSALVSAPMERVAEHTFSFRPNLKEGGSGLEFQLAIVESVAPLQLKLVGSLSNALFVEQGVANRLAKSFGSKWKIGVVLPADGDIDGAWLDKKTFRKKLCAADLIDGRTKKPLTDKQGNPLRTKWPTVDQNYLICSYRTGIDGEGELLRTFNDSQTPARKTNVYKHMLVPENAYKSGKVVDVPADVVSHFKFTHEHLSDDRVGHFANHPLKSSDELRNRVRRTRLTQHQALLVEVETGTTNLTSVGPHYRYRNRYSSTVRTRWDPQNKTDPPKVRGILSPLEGERLFDPQHSDQQSRLSAVRRLFGFADKDIATESIGEKDLGRLAGRVAINCALEMKETAGRQERFVCNGAAVPLKELGSPKPSAFEFYLRQDEAAVKAILSGANLASYGDTLADGGGELAGRKFYLHQPDAATNESRFSVTQQEARGNDRSAYALWLLRSGATFRFRIRFRDLDLRELGALVAVLEPKRWLDWAKSDGAPERLRKITDGIDSAAKEKQQSPLALKLGHGRPLGLGSVVVDIKDCKRLEWIEGMPQLTSSVNYLNEAFIAFVDKLDLNHSGAPLVPIIAQWLKVQRFAGRPNMDYPTAMKDGATTIYNFHTEARGDWSSKRRARPSGTRVLSEYRLADLDD